MMLGLDIPEVGVSTANSSGKGTSSKKAINKRVRGVVIYGFPLRRTALRELPEFQLQTRNSSGGNGNSGESRYVSRNSMDVNWQNAFTDGQLAYLMLHVDSFSVQNQSILQ